MRDSRTRINSTMSTKNVKKKAVGVTSETMITDHFGSNHSSKKKKDDDADL